MLEKFSEQIKQEEPSPYEEYADLPTKEKMQPPRKIKNGKEKPQIAPKRLL